MKSRFHFCWIRPRNGSAFYLFRIEWFALFVIRQCHNTVNFTSRHMGQYETENLMLIVRCAIALELSVRLIWFSFHNKGMSLERLCSLRKNDVHTTHSRPIWCPMRASNQWIRISVQVEEIEWEEVGVRASSIGLDASCKRTSLVDTPFGSFIVHLRVGARIRRCSIQFQTNTPTRRGPGRPFFSIFIFITTTEQQRRQQHLLLTTMATFFPSVCNIISANDAKEEEGNWIEKKKEKLW